MEEFWNSSWIVFWILSDEVSPRPLDRDDSATMATRQVKNYAEWLGLDPKDRWLRGWILARAIAVISTEVTPLIECIIP